MYVCMHAHSFSSVLYLKMKMKKETKKMEKNGKNEKTNTEQNRKKGGKKQRKEKRNCVFCGFHFSHHPVLYFDQYELDCEKLHQKEGRKEREKRTCECSLLYTIERRTRELTVRYSILADANLERLDCKKNANYDAKGGIFITI